MRHSTLYATQMHSLLNLYLSDVSSEELPTGFTESVTRAVIARETDYVKWTDFREGFPVALRQRHILWDQWRTRHN
jgi:hypothetical protein